MSLTTDEQTRVNYLLKHHPDYYLGLLHHRTHQGKPLTFTDHEYLRAIFLDRSAQKVIMKSTQCGITEWLITEAISKAGLLKRSVFYVLPTHPLKTRFVTNRWDKSVSYTRLYQRMSQVSMEKRLGGYGESMSLKQLNGGTVAFVSSQSRASFTEYPADDVIIDEVDECDKDNIEMADDRLAHSADPTSTKVGNPTIQGLGIHEAFAESDQKYWFIKCPHCGRRQVMDWFTHVVRKIDEATFALRDLDWQWGDKRDIHVMCEKCEKALDRYARGIWMPTAKSDISGYQISRLFSSRATIKSMVTRFDRGLTNAEVMTLFWNAVLGLGFDAPGAKITRELLQDATGTHGRGVPRKGARCVMGVDVGTMLHVTIGQLFERPGEVPGINVVYIGTVMEIEEVYELYRDYHCIVGVMDAQPEMRMAKKFARRFPGAFRCFYANVKNDNSDDDKKTLTVERTSALDGAKEALMVGGAVLPADAESIPGFYDQMTAATRVREEKPSGEIVYVWREGNKPDHYHHGFTYMCLARNLATGAR